MTIFSWTRSENFNLSLFLEIADLVNKSMLINIVFIIFVSGVTCQHDWFNVFWHEKKKQVLIFLQAEETKLMSIKRYKLI